MPEFKSLIAGYHRFRDGSYLLQKQRWQELAEGQEPPAMVIGCCDSRVDPGMIFDTRPGQVFVLRNVANLVPPYEPDSGHHGASAAIEFAVTGLKIRHIVVLGHGACGGIAACLSGEDQGVAGPSFIDRWMSIISEARDLVLASSAPDPQRALELEAVKVSLRNLRSFPWVAEREQAGMLKLHGAYFAISDGVLHVLDEGAGVFSPA
jgi:carbonic anhydrase